IAAIEQIKTYAELLQIPIEVVYEKEDFQKAVVQFADYDYIFIDTAGRNYREKKYIDDLNNLIHFSNDMETFLVLSLTSKMSDMKVIYEQFSKIAISKFIFTKMDETSNIGPMYNMIAKYQKGVAYITNGQSVPDDIMTASAEGIVKSILEVERQ
ncbi:MAG: flagellar biosynthesis protein FlhF, partial [Bacillales bacterium]